MQFPHLRQLARTMRNGTADESMHDWGQASRHAPQPSQEAVISYPASSPSIPPKENSARSIGLFERSNHSPLPLEMRKTVRASRDLSVG